jgi:nucleoside-diphosphate-sugar epimerase
MNSKILNKFLIVGATGGSGIELINLLISKGKSVAIVVRDKTKAKTIFKENYEKIHRVIECELGLSQLKCEIEPVYNEDLLEGLNWCDVLISSLGTPYGQSPQQCYYMAVSDLLKHCQKAENKFSDKQIVYISTMYITRPNSFVAFILNSMISNVMGWKALAENRIRQSGLNYLIVRPGRLMNTKTPLTVEVQQGDKGKGRISRFNLANMILHSLSDSNVNKGKVTVEVVEKSSYENTIEIKKPIQLDDESSFITADHFRTTRDYTVMIFTILTLILIGMIWKFK